MTDTSDKISVAETQAHMLAFGDREARRINAIRNGDEDAALAIARERFGNSGAAFVARGIVAAVKRIDADVPGYRVIDTPVSGRFVFTPRINSAPGRRPAVRVDWLPMFSVAEAEIPVDVFLRRDVVANGADLAA